MAFVFPPPLVQRRPRVATRSHRAVVCTARRTTRKESSRLEALSTWLASSGADFTTLSPVEVPDGGRGMVTNAPRRKGDWLARVPASLALQDTSLDGKRSPFAARVPHEVWAKLPWYARLALRLLVARSNPDDARTDYFRALPRSFSTPYHWSDDDLDELQSPRLVRAIQRQRDAYKSLFKTANVADWATLEEWVWAIECVRSRAFAGELETAPFSERVRLFAFVGTLATVSAAIGAIPPGRAANGALTAVCAVAMYDVLLPRILGVMSGVRLKRYAVVPGIDFMNHSSRVNGKAEVSFEYFSDRFVVMCGEDYEADSEVAISYGAQSNDSFLMYYGFVEEKNPADDYKFDPEVENLLGVAKGSLAVKAGEGFSSSVIADVAKRFSGDENAARVTLVDLCRAELEGKATSLEEDLALSTPGIESRRIALAYRIEKKRVLSSALALLEADVRVESA